MLNVAQVFHLATAMPERYKALILVATFGCLRWGEVSALQRQDVDMDTGVVRIRQAFTEQRGIGLQLGPPKSRASRRTVSLPPAVVPSLVHHMIEFVKDDPAALVFTGPSGRPIWRGNLNKLLNWIDTTEALGLPGLHFHDLLHTGNTMATGTGASLRDLMARMGHDSPSAALIYQHATRQADQAIAKAVSALVDAENGRAEPAAKRAPKRRNRGTK